MMWINITFIVWTAILVLTKLGNVDMVILDVKSNRFITINTQLGKVQGKVNNVTTDDGQLEIVYTYRNIPYAQPPVGDLRWRPPISVKPWEDVLEYSDHKMMCKQFQFGPKMKMLGKEDCLILTIRQPARATDSNRLPVLVWIHGGGLVFGSSDWYYPDEQTSASIEMVTVSINYRLNIFGFLSVEEIWSVEEDKTKYYGNFGILDAIQALQWVKENIHSFGGDPHRVTILGQSSGGAAIYSLLTSPFATGLFTKAIAASGYETPAGNTYENANLLYGASFKEDTGCHKSNSSKSEVVACLRNLSANTVLQNQPSVKRPLDNSLDKFRFPFNKKFKGYPVRVYDGYVLPEPLGEMTKFGQPGLKVLIGNTAQEAIPEEESETWKGLESYLKPRVDSFSPGLLPTLVKLYNESCIKKNPQFVYKSLTTDVFATCKMNEIVRNLSMVPGMTVYRYIASQPKEIEGEDLQAYAYHGFDTDALFGKSFLYNLIGIFKHQSIDIDPKVIRNVRKTVKAFVYDEMGFHAKYHGKTIEFRESEILAWDRPYHETECEVLRDYGLTRLSW